MYSFSTENWSRPAEEVQGLMAMFARRIGGETPELHCGGRAHALHRPARGHPRGARRSAWTGLKQLTDANSRITLFVAFNYGGRAEIVDAARAFTGGDEEEFASCCTRRRCTTPT